jgi:hypothetical protein
VVDGRRRSPRRGRWTEAFDQLVFLKGSLAHPRLAVHIVSTVEEEWRLAERRGGRRRRPRVIDRRLIALRGVREFSGPRSWASALPEGLPAPFQSAHLARALDEPRWRAQAMLYVLGQSGAVRAVGRDRGGVWWEARSSRSGLTGRDPRSP